MGEDIRTFCIEGMQSGFRKQPGSQHHIQNRAAYIDSRDSEVGKKLRQFLNLWVMAAHKDASLNILDARTAVQFSKEAQELGEELLTIAREWER